MPQGEDNPVNKNREQDVLWREQVRQEDKEFRDATRRRDDKNRKEDVEFRVTTRQFDQDRRRKDARLANRRSALAAAAEVSELGTNAEKVLELAELFLTWTRKTDAKGD